MCIRDSYQTVEEVAFHTHHYVVRAVATQKQIAWCLNHYYDIENDLFRSLPSGEPEEAQHKEAAKTEKTSSLMETRVKGASNKIIVDLYNSSAPNTHSKSVSGHIAVMTPLPPSDDLEEIVKTNNDSLPLAIAGPAKNESEVFSVRELESNVEDSTQAVVNTLRAIDRAKTRDAVIESTLRYLAKKFKSAAFLAAQKKHIKAWMLVTEGHSTRPNIQIPIKEDSLFGDVISTQLPYSGKIYDDDSLSFLMKVIGPSKNHFLLIPVTTNGKAIGILVAYHAMVEPSSEQLAVVLKATTGALKNLIIEKKVRLATQDQ